MARAKKEEAVVTSVYVSVNVLLVVLMVVRDEDFDMDIIANPLLSNTIKKDVFKGLGMQKKFDTNSNAIKLIYKKKARKSGISKAEFIAMMDKIWARYDVVANTAKSALKSSLKGASNA